MTNESNPPKKRGCFFFGCLGLVAAVLLGIVILGGTYWFLKKQSSRWIEEYTETTPALVEKLEYSREQMKVLQGRLANFKQALDKGDDSTELVLTADDLNALISDEAKARGRLFVRIEEERITGDVSWPLENIGPLKLQGRYLNGTATFKAALENGVLDVRVQEVLVKAKPLPGVLLSELKKHNLAQEHQKDPKVAADIAKFESIQVTNSRIVLRNRSREP